MATVGVCSDCGGALGAHAPHCGEKPPAKKHVDRKAKAHRGTCRACKGKEQHGPRREVNKQWICETCELEIRDAQFTRAALSDEKPILVWDPAMKDSADRSVLAAIQFGQRYGRPGMPDFGPPSGVLKTRLAALDQGVRPMLGNTSIKWRELKTAPKDEAEEDDLDKWIKECLDYPGSSEDP